MNSAKRYGREGEGRRGKGEGARKEGEEGGGRERTEEGREGRRGRRGAHTNSTRFLVSIAFSSSLRRHGFKLLSHSAFPLFSRKARWSLISSMACSTLRYHDNPPPVKGGREREGGGGREDPLVDVRHEKK